MNVHRLISFAGASLVTTLALALSFGSLAAPVASQASADCAPAANFLDVSQGSAGDGFAPAQVSVSCTADSLIIESNGMINYEFVAMTPNALTEQDKTYTLPLAPVLKDEADITIQMIGSVGVTINGIPIFTPNEAGNLGFGDPYTDNILDTCNGHTGAGGEYHYHARPECLLPSTEPADLVGFVIGYGFDGFPILMPYVCEDATCTTITEVQSSYQLTNPDERAAWEANEYVEGSGDLDECNGAIQPDGSYAYYATDTFPYMIGCLRGESTMNTLDLFLGGGDQAQQGAQNGQAGPGGQGQGQRPDLAAAALTLGVTEQALRAALGDPTQGPPNFAAAAAALGIPEQALMDAIGGMGGGQQPAGRP